MITVGDDCWGHSASCFIYDFILTQQTFVLMKTSWRRLEDVLIKISIFVLAVRIQDVLKTSCKNVFKTSSRRLAKTSSKRLQDVLQKCLQDVSNKFWRRFQDFFQTSCKNVFRRRLDKDQYIRLGHTYSRPLFKTSSRRFAKTSSRYLAKTSSRHLQDVLQSCLQDVFKTLNCLPRSRIWIDHTSEKFMVSVENLQVW